MSGTPTKNRTHWRAAAASAVLPGLGQLSVGRRGIGWSLVLVSLLVMLTAIAAVLGSGATEVAAWLVDPEVLLMILVVNLIVAGVRLWSTASAWHSAGGPLFEAGLAAMLLLVALPHVAVGYVAAESRSALREIFLSEPVATPVATTTTSVAPTSTSAVRGAPLVAPNPIPTSSSTTTTTLPLGTERLTVLLLGGDAGPDRTGLRTDTMKAPHRLSTGSIRIDFRWRRRCDRPHIPEQKPIDVYS